MVVQPDRLRGGRGNSSRVLAWSHGTHFLDELLEIYGAHFPQKTFAAEPSVVKGCDVRVEGGRSRMPGVSAELRTLERGRLAGWTTKIVWNFSASSCFSSPDPRTTRYSVHEITGSSPPFKHPLCYPPVGKPENPLFFGWSERTPHTILDSLSHFDRGR